MARKPGLGKGLDALIPDNEPSMTSEGSISIAIDRIQANPHQPRFIIKDDDLQELALSILEHGILQPLIVTHEVETDDYFLIAGERRLRAARLANLTMVPVIIRQATDQQRLELALIENIQRADLTPLETAGAYYQLNTSFNLSHEEIARRVGKSRVTITNTMRLLKLPKSVRNALEEHLISEGHARAILGLNTENTQNAALQVILKQELNVRQTEELVRIVLGLNTEEAQNAALQVILKQELSMRQAEELVRKILGQKPPSPPKKEPSPEILAIEENLRERLGTKVALQHRKNGGNLTIYYYSDEELESIINQLLKE
ncbi:MAG: ParB/RepB/Spo0J family partition protein [Anaerolineaceae bacterium]|nr:ParB/RepB/Spo0J family partition protein [Anaerolineaceae bacterium]